MVGSHRRFFLLVTLAAFALRLIFYFKFPHVTGDSLIYGDIARNWLDTGTFGLTHTDGVHPTLIRLPGYPAFLAACFVLFGREHYHAVLLAQIVIDVANCFVIADLARRTVSERAARFAFLLAALCPFTANYTVAPLAETLSIFFVAIALDAAAAGLNAIEELGAQVRVPALDANLGSQVAIAGLPGSAAARGFLRHPASSRRRDSARSPSDSTCFGECGRSRPERARLFWAGALVLAISIAPLVPWTIRNWRDFHRFQPLVPQSASDPDEFVPDGFDKWTKTWAADYVSTEEVYWQVPGDKVDLTLLPRAPSTAPTNAPQRKPSSTITPRSSSSIPNSTRA